MPKVSKPSAGRLGRKTPKLPAFKYSTRNKSDAAYRDRLQVLKKKYGIESGISVSKKLTPQKKSAITRHLRKVKAYLNPENRFKFVELTPKKLKAIGKRGDLSPDAITKKGFFIQLPKTKKRVRVSVKDDGEIVTEGGEWQSSFALYNSIDVVQDPTMIERDARKRRASNVFVSIKGFRGKRNYRVKDFMFYLNETLLPDLEESVDMESGAFKNFFGVEFVSLGRKRKKNKKSVTKKKVSK